NPTEQSRLEIFLSKEIFEGEMVRIYNAFVHDEDSTDCKVASIVHELKGHIPVGAIKIKALVNFLWSIPTASEEFPLAEQFPTSNEDKLPLLSQSDATAEELCAAAEVKE
nr:hypothetical protein [Tanacetum cinerariifolium]